MLYILSLVAVSAAEPEMVDAATLSILPAEYDGKRVQTELSMLSVLNAKAAKAMGCKKSAAGFMLGPKLEMGKAPSLLQGSWVLCADTEITKSLAPLSMSTGLVLEADVTVKGPKVAPKILLNGVKVLETKPLL